MRTDVRLERAQRSPAGASTARASTARASTARASSALRRNQCIGAFAAVVVACAVWVQAGTSPGVTDRPGSGPLAALGTGPAASDSASLAAVHQIIVQPGDTIWDIARALQPSGDIRPLVDALSDEVHGQPLQVGQRLTVP
jgi:nucleoid-associated protein YgaU